jgi:phage-related protein
MTFLGSTVVLLHAYQKQSQKAPKKEIEIAERRMLEVIKNVKNYT